MPTLTANGLNALLMRTRKCMGACDLEWNLILDEWREHQRQHAHKRVTLNGPLLGQFLQRVEQEETFSLQHEREYEEQALRRLVNGRKRAPTRQNGSKCVMRWNLPAR